MPGLATSGHRGRRGAFGRSWKEVLGIGTFFRDREALNWQAGRVACNEGIRGE